MAFTMRPFHHIDNLMLIIALKSNSIEFNSDACLFRSRNAIKYLVKVTTAGDSFKLVWIERIDGYIHAANAKISHLVGVFCQL